MTISVLWIDTFETNSMFNTILLLTEPLLQFMTSGGGDLLSIAKGNRGSLTCRALVLSA